MIKFMKSISVNCLHWKFQCLLFFLWSAFELSAFSQLSTHMDERVALMGGQHYYTQYIILRSQSFLFTLGTWNSITFYRPTPMAIRILPRLPLHQLWDFPTQMSISQSRKNLVSIYISIFSNFMSICPFARPLVQLIKVILSIIVFPFMEH